MAPKTKIICTIGPSSSDRATLKQLLTTGMNVARLNFAHGTREEHAEVVARLREIAASEGRPLAILQDLAGPKVRVGTLADGPIQLEPGDTLTLTTGSVSEGSGKIPVTYKNLARDVRAGDTILLSDGTIELAIDHTTREDVVCRVIIGGPLSSHKGINLPARSIAAPALSEKDIADLEFGLKLGVDYVALSFVRSAEEIEKARTIVRESGSDIPVIAKIEKHEALDRINEILDAVDGIMIARGDLGVEIPIERVPRVQKDLIVRSNRAGKPVITATQMLKSMVESVRPTRAEAADVANAVLDGTDALMLSEETAIGSHPAAAVAMMSRIASDAEEGFPHTTWAARLGERARLGVEEAVAHSACRMADEVGATAIVSFTRSGATARLVAKYRPRQPVLALTPERNTYRRLAVTWGAIPLMAEPADSAEEMKRQAVQLAMSSGHARKGYPIIITAGLPADVPGTTNLIRVAVAG